MGKPGAILLLGVGTFILVLGWQGRLSMVWDVMKGTIPTPDLPGGNPGDIFDGGKPTPDPGDPSKPPGSPGGPPVGPTNTEAPNPDTGLCGTNRQKVVIKSNNEVKCILTTDIAGPGNNGQCTNGYVEVVRSVDGLKMCIRVLRGGGGAVPNDYGWVMQPTGAMVRRYQPNVRAID
jgi:hypothetical protein